MKLHLKDIETLYINVETHTEKRKAMENLLKDFSNAKRIDAVVLPDVVTALSMSHAKALKTSTETPLLILEDDCFFYDNREVLDIPDDADIVFLGNWDVDLPPFKAGKYIPGYEPENEDIVRLYSMFGSHAILYTSEVGKKVAMNVYDMAIRTGLWNDVVMNRALPFVKAYAFKIPVFAQESMLDESSTELDEFVPNLKHFTKNLTSPLDFY